MELLLLIFNLPPFLLLSMASLPYSDASLYQSQAPQKYGIYRLLVHGFCLVFTRFSNSVSIPVLLSFRLWVLILRRDMAFHLLWITHGEHCHSLWIYSALSYFKFKTKLTSNEKARKWVRSEGVGECNSSLRNPWLNPQYNMSQLILLR